MQINISKSKTKWGATLIGIGLIIGSIVSYKAGTIDVNQLIQQLIIEIGGVLTAWGIRDIPLLNKTN